MVPNVAPNRDPIIAVPMQYWFDAGTELLAAIAQIGRAMLDKIERTIRVTLRPYLLVFIYTGYTIFSVLGLLDTTI